jgi:low affinity Fe/Cu permease
MGVLQSINDSALSTYMRESLWGYPIALTLHAIGMGLLVGVVCIMNLRVLGYFRQIPFPGLSKWFPVIVVGFLVNLCSGTMLYLSDPVQLLKNWAFDVKIVLVFVGMILLLAMRATPAFKNIANMPAAAIGGNPSRVIAVVSLIVWITAITSGRLTGYVMVE